MNAVGPMENLVSPPELSSGLSTAGVECFDLNMGGAIDIGLSGIFGEIGQNFILSDLDVMQQQQ